VGQGGLRERAATAMWHRCCSDHRNVTSRWFQLARSHTTGTASPGTLSGAGVEGRAGWAGWAGRNVPADAT
jgi:hypothetical protein